MKKYFAYFFVSIAFLSCKNSATKPGTKNSNQEEFIQDTVFVDNTFPPYKTDSIPKILEDLGLCYYLSGKEEGIIKDTCHHELFRIFPLQPKHSFTEGFLLESRDPALNKGNIRRAIVVVNNNGFYEIVNDYFGAPLEFRTTKHGNYEIVMKYWLDADNTITILHSWSKKGYYMPKTVLEINDRFVKKDKVDSLNKVYIDNFLWGL